MKSQQNRVDLVVARPGDFQGCVRITSRTGLVEIRKAGLGATDPGKSFTFDTVYDWNSKQNELYLETFSPLVDSGKEKFNSCQITAVSGCLFTSRKAGQVILLDRPRWPR